MAKPTAAAPDAAPTAAAPTAPGPVPASEIPMCWVVDADSPTPYLINVADFDDAKHTRCA